jgi:hypothetical protein
MSLEIECLSDYLSAEVYALIADVNTGTGDQLDDVELALGTKRTAQRLLA